MLPLVQNWSLNDYTAVKSFTIFNLFYYVGQIPDVLLKNRKKRNDKEHLEQVRKGQVFLSEFFFFV